MLVVQWSLVVLATVSFAALIILNKYLSRMAREQQRLRQSFEVQLGQLRSEMVSAIGNIDLDGDNYADATADVAKLATELVNLNMKLKEAGLEQVGRE